MILLLAMILLAQEPAAAPPSTPTPAAAPPTVQRTAEEAEIFDRIDRQMTAWKGRKGDALRGRLGLTETVKWANDGIVMFWRNRDESMACGVGSAGQMACGPVGAGECLLGVIFDFEGKVKSWKASGSAPACRKFVDAIGAP